MRSCERTPISSTSLDKPRIGARVGGWWSGAGQDPDESDVVAYSGGELVLIGECKWTNALADENDLRGVDKLLRDFTDELSPAKTAWRAIFSRSGFSADLKELAREKGQRLLLIAPTDLYW